MYVYVYAGVHIMCLYRYVYMIHVLITDEHLLAMSASIPAFVLLLLIVIVATVIACVVVRCRIRFSKTAKTTEPSNEDENIYDEVDVGKTESEHCNIKMTDNPAYSDTNNCVIVN